ncbi:hypothetical protein BD560DRAFT_463829 [Blakeslea trispora]|nr:hypothetical protein BD560DRAFT_463829 [Blakeslea trispora]
MNASLLIPPPISSIWESTRSSRNSLDVTLHQVESQQHLKMLYSGTKQRRVEQLIIAKKRKKSVTFFVVDDSCEFWLQSILRFLLFFCSLFRSFYHSFFLSALTTNSFSLQNRILYGGLEMFEREKKDVEAVSCERQTARQPDSQTADSQTARQPDSRQPDRQKTNSQTKTTKQTDKQTNKMSSCKAEDWFKIARERDEGRSIQHWSSWNYSLSECDGCSLVAIGTDGSDKGLSEHRTACDKDETI